MQLFDYQSRVLDDVRYAIRGGARSILMVLPTGSGKTVCGAHMIHSAESKGNPTLFTAHRRELVNQTVDKLQRFGVQHGTIMAGKTPSLWHGVQVASVDTLRARCMSPRKKMELPRASILMVDEAHRSCSPTYTKLIDHYRKDSLVIGLTATPIRGDGKGLGRHYDEMVVGPTVQELIDMGRLVQPKYFVPSIQDLTGVPIAKGDYVEKHLGNIMGTKEVIGDVVEHYGKLGEGPALLFAPDVKSSIGYMEAFNRAGISAAHIDASTPADERDRIIAGLLGGRFDVCCNVMVLCLDTETEILTDRGWTNYREMTKQHKVANWEGGRVWFEGPQDVVVRDRDPSERMFSIETRKKSIRVTSGHRMLYRTKHGGRFLKCPVDELEGRSVQLPITGRIDIEPAEVTLDECMFAGFFVGDGSRCQLQRGGVEYVVSQSFAYPKIIAWFDALILRCGLHCVRKERAYAVKFVRWSFCRGTGGKSQKRNGGVARLEWLLDKSCSSISSLSASQFEAFMHGLWMADGNHGDGATPVKNKYITSCNKYMLDNIQAAATVRGMRVSLSSEILPRKANHRSQWTLSFCHRDYCSTSCSEFKAENIWRPEKVWCVKTTSKNIITRRQGKVVVMGNTEGFDCPPVRTIIMCRPTRNIGLYLQIGGRGLRTSDGKDSCIVIDHSGSVYEHGLLEWDHEWKLTDAEGCESREERQKKLDEKKPITCVQCSHVYTGQLICPNCGHMPKKHGKIVESRQADLVELRTLARQKKERKDKPREYTKEEKQLFFSMALQYAADRGHKDGSVAWKFKDRFGHFPQDMQRIPTEPSPEFMRFIQHLNIKAAYRRKKEAA
jgi:superfamily II DNA or RNA helicase